jgi:hypothetical protein
VSGSPIMKTVPVLPATALMLAFVSKLESASAGPCPCRSTQAAADQRSR